MGRPTSHLPLDKIEPALAYLQGALDRGADAFTRGRKETQRSLTALRQRGLTLRQGDFAAEANAWLETYVTSEGRRSMLAALRQRRASEKAENPRHTVRLPTNVHTELAALAEKHKLSLAETVSRLVAAAGDGGAARWLMENRAALDSSNRFVDEHGLPLEKHRQF